MTKSHYSQIAAATALCALFANSSYAALTVQVTDSAGQPVADAVVYAEGSAALLKSPVQVDIEQKDKKFNPLVTVVQTGTAINFPNNDTVRHHAYSFSAPKPFDIKLYSGTPSKPIVFDKAGTVVVGCNIHDQMIAYIQVVDTPFFAKTDASGRARIGSIVAGKYSLKTWHYKQATGIPVNEETITYKDDATITVKLNYKAS
ncbi:MAG: methylamine utilization protein [Pseudomonadota bacterium]